ncbi:MAG: glycosyltransferase family 2 protein [Candidatus Vogelbacteria bacterium]|nr:glycosyltransferase family 2 protein [Candidatus Vogelbacteria bacterium]
MKLSIIIPCHNEAKNIPLILSEYGKIIKDKETEIILVDNNSTDETAQILASLLPKYLFAKSVFEPVRGYGSAILAGLKSAKGDCLGWTHGDMQTSPNDILKALKLIESSNHRTDIFIKGLRHGRPFFDQAFTWGMSFFETIYLRASLYDINGQPNIFHRSFFKRWQNPPCDFSLDLYAFYLARRDKLRIIRFPVCFPERIHGQSNWNTGLVSKWKLIKRTLAFSRKLKRGNLNQ